MKTYCQECKRLIGPDHQPIGDPVDTHDQPVSTGLCKVCYPLVMAELEEAYRDEAEEAKP